MPTKVGTQNFIFFMIEDFRKTAPTPLAPIPFNVSAPFETEFENGLKIVLFEDTRFPLVSFRLAFRIGKAHETDDLAGVTAAVAVMLSEGTINYSSREFAEKIERLGAHLSASAGADNTLVSASCLSFYTEEILEMMSEMVLTPAFSQDELELYKQNKIENLKYQRSQASFLADEQISRIIYGEHPYHKVAPKIPDIENITREKLIELHAKNYIPNLATLIVVGNFEREELLQQIDERFGKWQRKDFVAKEFPAPPERTEKTLTIVNRKRSAQSNIVLSNLAIPRKHPDFFAVSVMNQILGAGASSRVFMNLREEKGYTYGAYTSFDTRRLAGSFEATSEVRSAVTGDALREFFYELNRIRDEKVSEEELLDAKNFLTGVFPIKAETQEGLTNLIVSQKLYDLPEDYLQTYREKINSISVEDVERVAKKYIQPEKIAIVIVGDADEILPQVKEYAEKIEIFDTEGNLQDISNYGKPAEAATVDVSGDWDLTIDFQGQSIPVSLTLEQADGKVSGKLESMLGLGNIENGKVSGNNFSAIATTEMQGQTLELSINGTVENNEMSGSLNAPMIPMPLDFSGKRNE